MAKFISPLDTELKITQTYHTSANNTAIDISAIAGTPVRAIADGVIGVTSKNAGSYCTLVIDNSSLVAYYVHTYRWLPPATKVKAGDIICYVAPKSLNGGYAEHLHLGLTAGYYIMDYFDRNIVFKTKYQDIKKEWFIGENLNWKLFKDLNYDNNSMSSSFKKGDKIIFTKKQNKRGGAGTGFADIGAYEKGEMAIIKDNPRTSQNAQFYGKGSSNKTNDKYTWYDTTPVKGGASSWVADMGKFRIATPEEINPTPTPEPPVPIPTPTPEPTNWQERYNEELEKNKGLVEDVRALEKEVKKLGLEIEQKEVEYRELREECDGLEEKNKMLEEERLLLQEKQEAELKDYRRWSWLVNILNTICPRK